MGNKNYIRCLVKTKNNYFLNIIRTTNVFHRLKKPVAYTMRDIEIFIKLFAIGTLNANDYTDNIHRKNKNKIHKCICSFVAFICNSPVLQKQNNLRIIF